MMKYQNATNKMTVCYGKITNLTLRSKFKVGDTSSGGGIPTCQIWKACLERQKSYSPDTICYGPTDQFDLEVKVQGQRSPTMVCDTSSGGGLSTYMPHMKSLSWMTKRLQPGYDLLWMHGPVWLWGQRSPTMVRNTSSGGGLPTCQICKACLERQKSYSPDTICYGRTDRLITIGHPPQSGGALIKYGTYQRGNQKP
jgi:hypothetical protein